jgi:hypothetical protein
MTAIDAIIIAAAAGFALVVVITAVVIIGIRQEERYLTLANKNAPSAMAQLTRIVLGNYLRKEDGASATRDHADDRSLYTRAASGPGTSQLVADCRTNLGRGAADGRRGLGLDSATITRAGQATRS